MNVEDLTDDELMEALRRLAPEKYGGINLPSKPLLDRKKAERGGVLTGSGAIAAKG